MNKENNDIIFDEEFILSFENKRKKNNKVITDSIKKLIIYIIRLK